MRGSGKWGLDITQTLSPKWHVFNLVKCYFKPPSIQRHCLLFAGRKATLSSHFWTETQTHWSPNTFTGFWFDELSFFFAPNKCNKLRKVLAIGRYVSGDHFKYLLGDMIVAQCSCFAWRATRLLFYCYSILEIFLLFLLLSDVIFIWFFCCSPVCEGSQGLAVKKKKRKSQWLSKFGSAEGLQNLQFLKENLRFRICEKHQIWWKSLHSPSVPE